MKKTLFAPLLAAVCILLAGCSDPYPADGPKLQAGDYIQHTLLYDDGSELTSEEIYSRSWRIGEKLELQDKLENLEEFRSYGKSKVYATTAEELTGYIAQTEQLTAAGYTIGEITDGRRYENENGHDVLLLCTADGDTLLGTVYEENGNTQLSSLFLLEQGEIPPTVQALDFSWNPYALSGFISALYDHRFPLDFNAMVGAILQGEDYFYCSDENNIDRLTQYSSEIFPPYAPLVANIFYADGVGQIVYKVSDAERIAILNDFDRALTSLIEQAVKQNDDPVTAAIALYRAYTYQIMYDYDAVTDAVSFMQNTDLSAYRALTEYCGRSEGFAAGYAYLCTQVGIRAISAGGPSDSGATHDWTLLELDGKYYYADPTMETEAGGTGLRYFGMNAQQRYENGWYRNDRVNIGHSNILWGNGLDISDTRFADLQQFSTVDGILRTDGKAVIFGDSAAGDKLTYTVD